MNHKAETKKAAKNKWLAEQLALFPYLPDCAQISILVVCAITGRSAASVWRDVANNRLPKPISAGPRCTRWIVGELRKSLSTHEPSLAKEEK